MIKREPLDNYDILPEAMETYLRYYGRHFNKNYVILQCLK